MVIILVFCVFTTRATRWQHQFVSTAFKTRKILLLQSVLIASFHKCILRFNTEYKLFNTKSLKLKNEYSKCGASLISGFLKVSTGTYVWVPYLSGVFFVIAAIVIQIGHIPCLWKRLCVKKQCESLKYEKP